MVQSAETQRKYSRTSQENNAALQYLPYTVKCYSLATAVPYPFQYLTDNEILPCTVDMVYSFDTNNAHYLCYSTVDKGHTVEPPEYWKASPGYIT